MKNHTKWVFMNILSSLQRPLPQKVTFVGINVRRCDMALPTAYRSGFRLPTVSYFKHAMNYFQENYNDSSVFFLVGSNDMEWCKIKMNFTNIIFLHGNEHEDLDVLSSYHHVIMSVGAFGWWVSFLSHGEVIYFKDPYAKSSKIGNFYKIYDLYPPS